jgi:nucleotide-binding universal stress UspA family protein
MEGIIVGVNESSRATAALCWAVACARLYAEPVTAIMAWGYLDQHHVDPADGFDPGYSAAVADKVLGELIDRAVTIDAGLVRSVAVNDLPARALLEAATDAAMLVVGARSINPARVLVRDSVSRQVLHAAPCPVIVVRDTADRHAAPIVVGLDGSEPSRRALLWALDHARLTGRRVVAVHAADLPAGSRRVDDGDALIHEQLDQADTGGLVGPIECVTVPGSPIDALLEASATASIVVVGSRGRGAVSRAVLGSVSDRVSHIASAPVAVIP